MPAPARPRPRPGSRRGTRPGQTLEVTYPVRWRLLALDLDGTLLDAAGRLPAPHREAVRAVRAAGVEVVLVTGRSWHETVDIYRQLELTAPAITFLGAQVRDAAGRVLAERRLEPEAAAALVAAAEAPGGEPLALSVCLDSGDVVANRRPPDFGPWAAWNPHTRVVGPLAPHLAGRPAPVFVAAFGAAAVRGLAAAFPGGLPATQVALHAPAPDEVAAFFWHGAVDKGTALADLCTRLGVAPDQVVAMGDSALDLPMLRWAGCGVAMAAAPPEVKAACRLVADAGDPYPVATALARLGLVPRPV